jgi:hypothetical protein
LKNRIVFLIALASFSVVPVSAQEWQRLAGMKSGAQLTRVEAIGKTPSGTIMTMLTAECYPGKRGYISLSYAVRSSDKISDFNFADFEGPDAPAMEKKLVTATVRTRKGTIVVSTAVSGGLTVGDEPDTFQFSFGSSLWAHSGTMRLMNGVMNGGTGISILVKGHRDSSKQLYTEFPTTNAAGVIKQLLKDCGRR